MIRLPRTPRAPLAAHLLAVALALPAVVRAQESSDPELTGLDLLQSRIEAHLTRLAERPGFPGTSVAVVLPDGMLLPVVHGRADPELPALETSSRLMSGSIGKTYCAAVTLQLVGEGELALDAKVLDHLADHAWAKRLPNAEDLTLRHLLCHQSGIREHVTSAAFIDAVLADPDRTWTDAERLAFVLDSEPLFAAGEGWAYADTNYIVIAAVLEAVTGEAYDDLLRTRLLEPLELRDTVPNSARIVTGLVAGVTDGNLLRCDPRSVFDDEGRYLVNPQFEGCGGGISSTTADLAKWCHLWAAGGDRAFPAALWKQVVEDAPEAATGPGDRYGLGCQILQSPHGPSFGHSGYMPGYLSMMAHYPRYRLTLAIQHDTDDLRRVGRRLRTTVDELAGITIEALHLEADEAATRPGLNRAR